MGSLMIKGGRVIDPANGVDENLDILVAGGKIKRLGKDLGVPKGTKIVDAVGKIVTPGLVDMHVHLREPGNVDEETVASGSWAAALGGFTSIACMPNTEPVIDDAVVAGYLRGKVQGAGVINVYVIGALSKRLKGEELAGIGELCESGVVGISDDGVGTPSSALMRRAMEYTKGFGLPILAHCEDRELSGEGVMNQGYVSLVLGLRGIPKAAEEIMVARNILLGMEIGVPLHILHVSTKGSVELIRWAKRRGAQLSCEVTPHHLVLTEEAVMGYNTNAKVNPPLRGKEDVEALMEGLKDGTIDVIASDHAPHLLKEKEVEFDLAAFGMVGLETTLPIVLTELYHKGVLGLSELIAKLTINPAKVLGIPKGTLSVGAAGDITVIDLEAAKRIEANKFYSKSRNTAFDGWEVRGMAVMSIVGGEIVMERGEVLK